MARAAGTRPHTAFGRDDADSLLEPVVLHTDDRHAWDGLLWHPRRLDPRRADTAVLIVHGSWGNYLAGVPRRAAFALAHAGFPVLAINTRMANFGVVYGGGLLHETPRDLDAGMALLRARGFRRVVLMGHSMGATMITHYQALRRCPEVVGLVTLAHPASLRRSLRERWDRWRSKPSFVAVEAAARRALGDDPWAAPDDLVLVRRGGGPGHAAVEYDVWTHRTWWSRASGGDWATSERRIGAVGVPVLIVQAGRDAVIPAGDGELLAAAARAGGVPVTLTEIADADHVLWERVADAVDVAVPWIDALPRVGPPPPARRRAERTGGVRLVTLTAADGAELDALFHVDWAAVEARARRTGRRTAVVHAHGNQGNMTVGALRFLPGPLAAAGLPVLGPTLRVGNVAQLFGTAMLEDTALDLEAGVAWLGGQGFDRVVVTGYSLGAHVALWFAARGPAALPMAGVVALGLAWSLPQSTRRRMDAAGATPSYAELAAGLAWVGDPASAGRPDEPVVVRRCYGPDPVPRMAGVYTARTWWHSRGPEAVAAISHLHLGDVGAPLLLVQGDADAIVDPADAERLAAAARAAGNPDVSVRMIRGAGHSFHGGEAEVTAALASWLDPRA